MRVYACVIKVPALATEIQIDNFFKHIVFVDEKKRSLLTIKSHSEWCILTKDAHLGLDLDQLHEIYHQMREWDWI